MSKKFKDTKVGQFLKSAGNGILDTFGDVLPDEGVMGLVKNIIVKDEQLPAEDKEKALKLLELDMIEMKEVSKRWSADMKSDSWLSKNTRPLSLMFLTISMVFLILLDSLDIAFTVGDEWIQLLQTLLVTVYIAYFGSRGAEKFQTINKKT